MNLPLAQACHAVCDVSAVQTHMYFGLFGWEYATLKIGQKGEGPRACH